MTGPVIFFAWAVAVIIMFVLFFKYGRTKKVKIPRVEPLSAPKPNDRIIVVKNITADDLVLGLKGFVTQYEEDISLSAIKASQLSEKDFAVTFPYGIVFELFCYAINYLDSVFVELPGSSVRGWTTLMPYELKLSEGATPQRIMVYVSESDLEGDNVYLVTEENIGYKHGFAWRADCYLLPSADRNYITPPDLGINLHYVAMENQD